MKYISVILVPRNREVILPVDNIKLLRPTNHWGFHHTVFLHNGDMFDVSITQCYNGSMVPLKDPDSALQRLIEKLRRQYHDSEILLE